MDEERVAESFNITMSFFPVRGEGEQSRYLVTSLSIDATNLLYDMPSTL
jgi:hypothetical protein